MKSQKVTQEELVIKECRIIATEILARILAEKNLPLPKDSALEIHVDQLIATDSSIKERAKARVDARTDTFTEGLRRLGLAPTPIEIEL